MFRLFAFILLFCVYALLRARLELRFVSPRISSVSSRVPFFAPPLSPALSRSAGAPTSTFTTARSATCARAPNRASCRTRAPDAPAASTNATRPANANAANAATLPTAQRYYSLGGEFDAFHSAGCIFWRLCDAWEACESKECVTSVCTTSGVLLYCVHSRNTIASKTCRTMTNLVASDAAAPLAAAAQAMVPARARDMDRALVQARATRAARGGRGRAVRRRRRRRRRTRAAAAVAVDRTGRRTAARHMAAAAAIATGTEPVHGPPAALNPAWRLPRADLSASPHEKVVDIDGGVGIYVFSMTLADLFLFCLSFVSSLLLSHVCADYFCCDRLHAMCLCGNGTEVA